MERFASELRLLFGFRSWGLKTPEGLFLPIHRESHLEKLHERVFVDELCKPQVPAGARSNNLHQVMDDYGDGVESVMDLADERGVLLGHGGLDHELTVPKPCVMGADVSDVGQGMKPCAKHDLIHLEGARDGFSLGRELQVVKNGRPRSKGERFCNHPCGGKVGIGVFAEVVIDEDFVVRSRGLFIAFRDPQLFIDPVQQLVVLKEFGALHEVRGVHEPMRTVANAHLIVYGRPNGHFNALDGIHGEQPQFPVKPVKAEDVFELRPRLERFVWGLPRLQNQRVRRETVVADEGEVMGRDGVIRNQEASRAQFGDLTVDRQRRLVKLHASSH